MNIPRMAWRNVWRNRRRSLVSIAAMAFALMVCVLYSGLVGGYLRGMSSDLVELGVGELQVFRPEYRERPSIYHAIEDPGAVLTALDGLGFPASAQLLGGGLAAAGDLSAGVQLIGVDPARFDRASRLPERVAEGRWLDADDPSGVVLGKRLARSLGVKPGDELVVLTQATDGSMGNELYSVRGVLGTVGAYDRGGLFLNEAAFRALTVFPRGAHQIIVRLPEGVGLEAGKAAVVSATPGSAVLSWKELFPSMATMLESTESLIYMLYFIFYVAIGILILNSMLMAVFERVKELGVMKAIGLEPSKVLALIGLEAALQIAVAVVVGLVASLPGMWFLQTRGIEMGAMGGMNVAGMAMAQVWYASYSLQGLRAPVVMLVVMASLAVLYPAIKAARISPVVAMRHQ